ncbi:unnamed protein product [Rangifer tarandus platyrhynchus]|uniref:Uncharacterized protein n=1 Tax=Rangifer tarandus platyrhynchus TaxID=3082113 RepID=A0AC60A053_RANTA
MTSSSSSPPPFGNLRQSQPRPICHQMAWIRVFPRTPVGAGRQAAAAGCELHEADGSGTADGHGLATSSERGRGRVSESGRRRRRPSARSRLSAAAILGSQEPPKERARSVHAQRSHRPTASESEPRLHRRRGDPPLRTPPAPRPPSAAAAAAGPGGPR